jgi:RimJ/RimL family protein N-acetyltransferase
MLSLTSPIITERLTLNLVSENDFEFIFQLLNSKDWITFIGDRNIASVEAAKSYIAKIQSTQNFHYWVIRIRASNIPVGIISFIKRDYLPHFDIGFALLPQFYGNGYAFEAATRFIDECKRVGHETILATVLPTNSRSIALLEKLGFRHDSDIVANDERMNVFSLTIQA